MAKLNQIVAIEKGVKSRVYSEIGELDKSLQKPDLFNGFQKTYEPLDSEGENLPAERKLVQRTVPDTLRTIQRLSTELFDVTARKDWSNTGAVADIVVDDKTLIPKVPVTFLLFLEKQLTDLRTIVSRLPLLDVGDEWKKDEQSGIYKTEPTKQHRTKKLQKAIVLIQPTIEHPGQAQLVTEDVLAGHWITIRHSGAIGKSDRDKLAERVEKLLQAVKQAREHANSFDEAAIPKVSESIFGYLMEN